MKTLPPLGDRRRLRVGLLGGSFNPAHEGHVHISAAARRALGLDQVWWLVSPQNRLKSTQGMAPFARRLAQASAVAADHRIIVSDIEQTLGTARTADTLTALQRRYPAMDFVWLMGADNLEQFPRWWRWAEIYRLVRVAVFDRSPYSYSALAGAAAQRFAAARREPKRLFAAELPAWSWVPIRRHPASATALRAAEKPTT
jgi:nicotinate-nucleotide adenylyltransferase